ncbi:MAG TPA: hypothetical protein VFG78_10795 [Gemmatimonadota bacterium]|nr:hypothetical protein [Gemmatimonadota bacterium]
MHARGTERALIARIPIEPDGSAGTPEVVAAGFELFSSTGWPPTPMETSTR